MSPRMDVEIEIHLAVATRVEERKRYRAFDASLLTAEISAW